jgi:protein-S-isoprenylcysteine O-methyltransferase Ste14
MERFRLWISKLFFVAVAGLTLVSSSRWEQISIMADVLFALGCILVGVAAIGRLWCSLYIAGYKNHVLVTAGPYSMVRHPLYFFSLVGGVGIGLTTETLLIPGIILVAFALYYPAVIRSEERRLQHLYGELFQSYRRQTPAFFPRLSLLKEPESYTVIPKTYRKHMIHTLWFIWLPALVEIIEALHERGVLPIWWRVY